VPIARKPGRWFEAMSDPFHVPSSERGAVRVFTTDLEPEGDAAITPENVYKLLGDGLDLDSSKIEVFPSKAIEPIGLAGYLHEGYGVPSEDLKGTEAALNALTGLVILVASSAFKGVTTSLDPNPGLRFVGVYKEPRPEPPMSMAETDSADGFIPPPVGPAQPYDGRRGSTWRIALLALLVAAGLVLFLVL